MDYITCITDILLRWKSRFSGDHLIIISEKDMFDYSGGEPRDPDVLTVLRALEVGSLLLPQLLKLFT